MSTAAVLPEMTLEEFIARPAREDGVREELIEGELVLSPSPKFAHAFLVERLRDALQPLRSQGFYITNDSSVVLRPKSMPTPDLLVVREEKALAALKTNDWLQGSPELVIEVSSPSNRRLERKADMYLQHGAEQVWLLYPGRKVVIVMAREGDSPVEYRLGEQIEFHGIAVDLQSLFQH